MSKRISTHGGLRALTLTALLLAASSCEQAPPERVNPPASGGASPRALTTEPKDDGVTTAMRYLEQKVKDDPLDFIAYTKLADIYLQRLRNTSNADYAGLAERAARASLDVVPAEHNLGALDALIQVEIARHEFGSARKRAEQLIDLRPNDDGAHATLADVLIELGEYEIAQDELELAEELGGPSVATETRLGRLDLLKGDIDTARERVTLALNLAQQERNEPAESRAWCNWQLAEIAFATGDYAGAETAQRAALAILPDYPRSLAGLARAQAALGKTRDAIESYEHAIQLYPEPAIVAALGDLLEVAGREREAAAQYALVEGILSLGGGDGRLHSRALALFYADHDIKTDLAYASAAREFETRRDVYGADALAWSALKAGRIREAEAAMQQALRLGTRDAKLLYHAGMIAKAAGDTSRARAHLSAALELSPNFDPLHAPLARKALAES